MITTNNQVAVRPGLYASTDCTGITLHKGRCDEGVVLHLSSADIAELVRIAVAAGLLTLDGDTQ